MLKIFFALLALSVTTASISQKTIGEYKTITDQAIKKYFSRSVFKQVKCDTYILQESRDEGLTHRYYKEGKDEIAKVDVIIILYHFYSIKLDYEFVFNVIIDSSLHANFSDMGIDNIPLCVRKNKYCNFITIEEAKSIARKDSVEYPDNLNIEMEKPKNSDQFFWIVSGHDKKWTDYNKIGPKEDRPFLPRRKTNTRYINAVTGKILNYEDYQLIKE